MACLFMWVYFNTSANIEVDGKTLLVSSPKVIAPVAVRYGWADFPNCNLYNKAGLPAISFRNDTNSKQ